MKAFSLIELMVVIAIVGLLASIAVPVYRNYALKAKMTGIFNDFDRKKKIILDNHERGIVYSNSSIVLYPTGGANNPAFVLYANIGWNGCIEYTLNNAAIGIGAINDNPSLIYCPTDTNGVITWTCGYHPEAPGSSAVRSLLFPSACQGASDITTKAAF